jgi:hypothetical protein
MRMKTDRFRILLTMIPAEAKSGWRRAHASLTGGEVPVFESRIRRMVAFQKAALAGMVVT